METLKIQSIIKQYNPKGNEIIEVSRIGKMVATEMRKHQWLQWTKFPERFAQCRNEGQLYQMIDNFNGWLLETELFGKITEDVEDDDNDLVIFDDNDVIFGDLDD